MSTLQAINSIITVACYLSSAFFLAAIVKVFIKTRNIQDAILYSIIMIPFVLRILRLK
ncbi:MULTISPECIES: hypothetical protein [Sedimentibacter]|jgi:hypothetical protein|uniref:Uncharacterized protein n=1 Tax=Sedimentibacter saalensis TaxID=130788 RepID=A0A562JB29_9FIRM|nr:MULTISPECIES: hypothetical protein [Sedimentibacter]MEA5094148.1 hypothetical protein [Sedimentibacter saalensis]TWH80426.1 hypothetical protein LY60_01688 [Sedimentibacter saalensis]